MSGPPSRAARRRKTWTITGAALAAAAALALLPGAEPDQARPPENAVASGYQVRNGAIIWRLEGWDPQAIETIVTSGPAARPETTMEQTLSLADAKSFRILGSQYGRDKARVWFQAQEIKGADPASFTKLGYGLAHDKVNIWRGASLIMALNAAPGDKVEAHSARILTAGPETWLIGAAPRLLPEAPLTPPEHYCHDWFIMNHALWLGAQRLLPLEGPTEILSCNGDAQGRRGVSAHRGLLLRDGQNIWSLTLRGEADLLVVLPEQLIEATLIVAPHNAPPVLLARGKSDEVYAFSVAPRARIQKLGPFSALPEHSGISLGEAFWLEDRYFTLPPTPRPDGPVVIDHGPAERFGALALAGRALFYGGTIIARRGDLLLRQISDSMILVGPSCLRDGIFITDIPDPDAEREEIIALCGDARDATHILYQGLRIGFHPHPTASGPLMADARVTLYELGEIFIENTSQEPRDLPAAFLEGVSLRAEGADVKPPADAWPAEGVHLAPGQRHAWRLFAHSADIPKNPWTLEMRHSAARMATFNAEPFIIGRGRFGE